MPLVQHNLEGYPRRARPMRFAVHGLSFQHFQNERLWRSLLLHTVRVVGNWHPSPDSPDRYSQLAPWPPQRGLEEWSASVSYSTSKMPVDNPTSNTGGC